MENPYAGGTRSIWPCRSAVRPCWSAVAAMPSSGDEKVSPCLRPVSTPSTSLAIRQTPDILNCRLGWKAVIRRTQVFGLGSAQRGIVRMTFARTFAARSMRGRRLLRLSRDLPFHRIAAGRLHCPPPLTRQSKEAASRQERTSKCPQKAAKVNALAEWNDNLPDHLRRSVKVAERVLRLGHASGEPATR